MTPSTYPRPRWYAAAIVGTVAVLVALGAAALAVDHDLADTVLGFFTGLLATVLLSVVLWTEVVRRQMARLRDAAALDDLEPLRRAADADRADEQ